MAAKVLELTLFAKWASRRGQTSHFNEHGQKVKLGENKKGKLLSAPSKSHNTKPINQIAVLCFIANLKIHQVLILLVDVAKIVCDVEESSD